MTQFQNFPGFGIGSFGSMQHGVPVSAIHRGILKSAIDFDIFVVFSDEMSLLEIDAIHSIRTAMAPNMKV